MAFRTWEINKISYCEHVGHEIALETELVYPAEHLPDQPARVLARRCSNLAFPSRNVCASELPNHPRPTD